MKNDISKKKGSDAHPTERFILDEYIRSVISTSWQNEVARSLPPFCGFEGHEDILEEKLWEYVEHSMGKQEEKRVAAHVRECAYCLTKLIHIQRGLLSAQTERLRPYEAVKDMMAKKRRETKKSAIISRLADIVETSRSSAKKNIRDIRGPLTALFEKTFAHPTPRFDPVFGDFQVTVLSPFGKVRPPVVFEWRSYSEARKYILTIEEVDWTHVTTRTKTIPSPEELELEHGVEYTWELQVKGKQDILDEESGFFFLAPGSDLEETGCIEQEIARVKNEFDRRFMFAGVLELREYYMEAVRNYVRAYELEPHPGVAYRIAWCYDQLELENLREEWNDKILTGSEQGFDTVERAPRRPSTDR